MSSQAKPGTARAQRALWPVSSLVPPAIVRGESLSEAPKGLYVPPDALRVLLDGFAGPLDLLLHLVRRYDLDILDIDVALVVEQYLRYVEAMRRIEFSLVGDYLLMAATLVDLKSRMLLPKPPRVDEADEDGQDPKADLLARLCEYERFKRAALDLDALPRVDRDTWPAAAAIPPSERRRPPPRVALADLVAALNALLRPANLLFDYHIGTRRLSVRERMVSVLSSLRGDSAAAFESLLDPAEGKTGVVVTFLALLELMHESLLDVEQDGPLAAMRLRAAS